MSHIRLTLALALAVAAAIAAGALVRPAEAGNRGVVDANALEAPLLDRINGFRARHGLPRLRASAGLAAAARAHSAAMGTAGFFAHSSQDGTPFWKRVQRFYPSRDTSLWTVGENLLWSAEELTPASALQMWVDSPGHRRVLLTRAYREIGIAAVAVANAPGVFGAQPVTIVTADFGIRS